MLLAAGVRALLPLVLSTSVACAGRPTAPASPAGASSPGTVSLDTADEVARFHVADIPEAGFTVRPDEVLVVAHGSEQTWTIEALDRQLTRRWSVPVSGRLQGLESFANGRVLVITANAEAPGDLQATVLGPSGERMASSTFRALLGSTCAKGNRYWLAPHDDGVVVQVVCGGTQWVRAELDSTLHVRQRSGSVTYGPMYVPDVSVHDRGPELLLVRDGRSESLGPTSSTHTVSQPQIALLGEDLVAARSLNEWLDDTARPRFAVRGVVSRHGARPWQVEVVPAHTTNDATTIGGVGTTRDGTVLVALEYGRDGRIAGVRVPAPRTPADARYPGLARGYAVAELDGLTGAPRRVLALQPRTTWTVGPFARVAATSDHVVLATGDDVFVFARHGRGVTPSPSSAAPGDGAAPPVATAVSAVDASRVVADLPGAWATVCGPRVAPAKPSPCRIESVALGKDGTVAVVGGYYRANQLGATKLPARAFEAGVVAVFSADGTLRWHKTWGASWHNGATRVLVRDDGAIVVVGHHGKHFSIDGHALPDRVVARTGDGQDLDFTANSPFIVVFDAAGTLALLDDVDAIAHGDHSTDPTRVCAAAIAQGERPDTMWLRADCAHDVRRSLLRGATFGPVEAIASPPPDAWPRTVTASGALIASREDLTTTSLLIDDGVHPRTIEAIAGRGGMQFLSSTPGATWLATTASRQRGGTWTTSLQVARIAPDGTVTTHELVAAKSARIDGMTVDDAGRPIVSIVHDGELTLAGHLLPGVARANTSTTRGRALVRLAADGATIDRIVVPAAPRGSCVVPADGQLTSMSARGRTLALTMGFGVSASCKVKDEPSIVLVLDLDA